MKKKMAVLAITVLALAMFVAPMVGVVYAGKGQTKRDFHIRLVGIVNENYDRYWEAGNNRFYRGRGFDIAPTGEFYVDIGTEIITKPYLGYEASLDPNNHIDPEIIPAGYWFTINVREVFSIYDDPVTHNEGTLRGTLELLSLGASGPVTGKNSFTGFGTGEFEGVKVKGITPPLSIDPTNPNPPYYYLVLDRVGTVMG